MWGNKGNKWANTDLWVFAVRMRSSGRSELDARLSVKGQRRGARRLL